MDTIVCLQPFLPLWEHFQNRVSVHINCTPDPTPRLRLTYWRAYLSLYIFTFVYLFVNIFVYICLHIDWSRWGVLKSIFSLASLSSTCHLPVARGQRQGGVVVDQQSPSKFISTGELRRHRQKTNERIKGPIQVDFGQWWIDTFFLVLNSMSVVDQL